VQGRPLAFSDDPTLPFFAISRATPEIIRLSVMFYSRFPLSLRWLNNMVANSLLAVRLSERRCCGSGACERCKFASVPHWFTTTFQRSATSETASCASSRSGGLNFLQVYN
jgi:hypothetical protein